MDYRPDPGGVFASDAHRHVLAHLDTPGGAGYSPQALHARLGVLDHEDHAHEILADLEADGDAEQAGGIYRQTERGHAKLTGSIANEPPPDITPDGPVHIPLGEPNLKTEPSTPRNPGPSSPTAFPGG